MRIRELVGSFVGRNPIIAKALSPLRRSVRTCVNYLEYRNIYNQSMNLKLDFIKRANNPSKDGVIAFITVKNEISRLPFCLEHHRRIGVEEFFVVDNNSNDGTYEYLLNQNDVTLLRTADSYRGAYYGITWVNHLIHTYSMNRWALFIDADELLYFEGMDNVDGINSLIERLNKVNQTYFYTPMIDLYAFDDDHISQTCKLDSKYSELNNAYHDVGSYSSGKKLLNALYALNGGPRARLLKDQLAKPNLVKFPLIKVTSKTAYIGSSHEFYPSRSECHSYYGWLVHLKLGTKSHELHSDPEIEKEHYGAGIEREVIASGAVQQLKSGDPQATGFRGLNSLTLIEGAIRGQV